MTNVDQFESVFRSAAKQVFTFERPRLEKLLVVTDLEGSAATDFGRRLRSLLSGLDIAPEWVEVAPDSWRTVRELIERVEREAPDLVLSYRNLKSGAWRWPYSLGEALDVLTQIAPCPVLVLPHPDSGRAYEHAFENTDVVMAVTSHLAGDARLVNYAARFTQAGGRLLLTHVEDDAAFERTLNAISKIPSIDTENAREALGEQLLKEPRDYVTSCRQVLESEGLDLHTEGLVQMGHVVSTYRELVEQNAADLLVFRTRDERQLAMHGLAYPLAVELRELPLLML